MPPKVTPLNLSNRGRRRLAVLRGALPATPPSDLSRLFAIIEPHPDLPGLEVVIPRLARAMPWVQLLCASGCSRYEGLETIAIALEEPQIATIWRPEAELDAPALSTVSNFLAGQVGRYPHYALYSELPGDRRGQQEYRVAPLIALYTLLCSGGALPESTKKACSPSLRRLLNLSHRESRDLARQFGEVPMDVEIAWQIFEHIRSISDPLGSFVRAAERRVRHTGRRGSAPPRQPGGRRLTGGRPPPISGPQPPELSAELPGPADELEGPTAPGPVVTLPPGPALDPHIARRTWAVWGDIANQHLYWVWPTLNAQEIALLARGLAGLLDRGDPIGLLVGLSLVTARDVSDILAIAVDREASADGQEAESFRLNLEAGTLAFPTALPANAYQPDEAARAELLPVLSRVCARLPRSLADACRRRLDPPSDSREPTIGTLLGLDPAKADAMVHGWCRDLRESDPRLRITPARIARWPITLAHHLSGDIASAAHAFLLDVPGSSILHYAGFRHDALQVLRDSLLGEVLGPVGEAAEDPDRVGSRLAVSPERLAAWAGRWKDAVAAQGDTRSLAGMVGFHNAYVDYTLALLLRWSGHRAVTDPFDCLDRFDAATGTVLIADKMTGGPREARIAWLPELAFAQVAAYVAHLEALGRRLALFDPILSARIARAGRTGSDLSAFFYLEVREQLPAPRMVRPAELRERLALQCPLYYGRNALSQGLRALGVGAEHVEYQLGHAQQGQDPMGPWSVLRVSEIASILRPVLEAEACREGWSVLRGLRSYPTRNGERAPDQVSWVPGPEQRAADRRTRIKGVNQKVLALLRAEPSGTWGRDRVDALRQTITDAFPQGADLGQAFSVARGWAARHHPEARRAIERSWLRSLNAGPDPSRYTLDDGLRLQQYRHCRGALRSWLTSLSEKSPMVEWDGALLASALLEDCLLAGRFLSQIPQAARRTAATLNGLAWLDLADSGYDPPAVRRLFLTPLSVLVVRQIRVQHAKRSSDITTAGRAAARRLLPGGTWADLLIIARAGARYRLSGLEYTYASGACSAVSLPETALVRVLTGRVLTESAVAPLPDDRRRTRRAKGATRASPDYMRGQRYRAALRRLLHQIVSRESQLPDPRRRLARGLARLEAASKEGTPVIIDALIVWLLRLLDAGREDGELRLGTIRGYYLAIARYVYEAAWDVEDFAALAEEDLEDLYVRALEYTTWRQRPVTAGLMEDFHRTLTQFGACAIDFRAIEPRIKARGVRANLATLAEYERARERLPLPERVLLGLLYRLGLRPGETSRVRPSDLWLEGKPVLLVRSRRGARTKTPAGVRQIPLRGRLTDCELHELALAADRCRDARAKTLWSLCDAGVLERVTRVLREVSGDYTLVPYDLRHSARTHMVQWLSLGPDGLLPGTRPPSGMIAGGEDYRRVHFASAGATRRSLYQEAVIAGHASPTTTIGVYSHLLDWITHQACLEDHPADDRVLAGLSGLTSTNIRQIRSRAGEGAGGGRSVVIHLLERGALPAPTSLVTTAPYESPPATETEQPSARRLADVAEALRLHRKGEGPARISTRLDYPQALVETWIERAGELEQITGYSLTKLEKVRSFVGRGLGEAAEALGEVVLAARSPGGIGVDWIGPWLDLWCRRYVHRAEAPVMADRDEMSLWLAGLIILGVAAEAIEVLYSPGLAASRIDELAATAAVRGMSRDAIRPAQKSITVRTANARSEPGAWTLTAIYPGPLLHLAIFLSCSVYFNGVEATKGSERNEPG